jgi:hypothetical protein
MAGDDIGVYHKASIKDNVNKCKFDKWNHNALVEKVPEKLLCDNGKWTYIGYKSSYPSVYEYKWVCTGHDNIVKEYKEAVVLGYRNNRDEDVNMNDNINSPQHYNQGKIEVIDFILDQKMGFLDGNVIKYVARYKHKNGIEDLKKAKWYLDKLISILKENN